MMSPGKRSPFFKVITIFLAFTFSSYNLGFSTIDGNAGITEVTPSYAGKDLSGIAGVPMFDSMAFQLPAENLAPRLTFGSGINLIFDDAGKRDLEELSRVMESATTDMRGFQDRVIESYMFFACGILVVQLDLNGNILYAVEKEVVVG